ncbi:MAG TPA: kelch repeat-containing protein, partial [Chloroflexia bacterium]|nr:kelch repeat-containing protein [Chloroflexia bacterium]
MSRRPGASILIPLLGLAVAAILAMSTGPTARAGAPPTLAPGTDGATTQQQNAPAQPYGSGGWALQAAMPGVSVELPDEERFAVKAARIKRAGAAFYPPNGKIYLLGGRMGIDGTDNPVEYYDPGKGPPGAVPYTWLFESTPGAPGTWARKQASIDPCPASIPNSAKCPGERYTSNMAVATLTDTTGVAIYAIGGSSVNSVPINRVRRYNPVADTMTYLDSDPWHATPARIPGGYAVLNNKLYVFGGFNPRGTGEVYGDTWVFDPMAAAGSKWSQLADNLSTPRAYIAGVALDGYIYAIGGDTWETNPDVGERRLVPTSVVERMNPLVGLWEAVDSLPQPAGDLGAWAYDAGT